MRTKQDELDAQQHTPWRPRHIRVAEMRRHKQDLLNQIGDSNRRIAENDMAASRRRMVADGTLDAMPVTKRVPGGFTPIPEIPDGPPIHVQVERQRAQRHLDAAERRVQSLESEVADCMDNLRKVGIPASERSAWRNRLTLAQRDLTRSREGVIERRKRRDEALAWNGGNRRQTFTA